MKPSKYGISRLQCSTLLANMIMSDASKDELEAVIQYSDCLINSIEPDIDISGLVYKYRVLSFNDRKKWNDLPNTTPGSTHMEATIRFWKMVEEEVRDEKV